MPLRILMVPLSLLIVIIVWLWHKELDARFVLTMQMYPCLVNFIMLGIFATSLKFPPTIIERIARLREPDLPPRAIVYTRRVTQVWCVFFIINGAIAFATALWASPKIWALYNGFISYLIMGLIFAIEYIIRLRVKRYQDG